MSLKNTQIDDIVIANVILVIRCCFHALESDNTNNGAADKKDLVKKLLEAKQASGKTYSEIANEVGLTNLYTAQLFPEPGTHATPHILARQSLPSFIIATLSASRRLLTQGDANVQAELKKNTAPALQKAVPGLTDELISQMTVSPLRQFDPQLIQEPLVYRLYEVLSLQTSPCCSILTRQRRPCLQSMSIDASKLR